ncbi:hypothetical protein AWH56_013985 [Anaerobacillus isosaccharinicus]|uniref:Uncharacterized protein n=1 Tax=Anaerobacillus isosaccharinicus TaxID=1532552 RepID=A0A1S2LS94_9BACI|nr:hypothetical protein [Anaerobacillus isosaccharinicus]MBA5587993.1 hypothetical protein [Anaerobacillus isosaccharinicus]QOY33861.1 hypothetical protein AWH56_013985 [Anaerobacillus isosaccharinicus]
MKGKIAIVLFIILLFSGCNRGNIQGQIDTPLEYSQYTVPVVNEFEYEQLLAFLYEAEIMMRKPIEEATINDEGVKVFSPPIITKDDLFHYYQTYLSNELAETMARKISDLSLSKDYEFLAVSNTDIDWFSIHDANPETIKVIQHTTVQSVVEMDLKTDPNTRIQYTIMKNRLGEDPKIVQKTVLYN